MTVVFSFAMSGQLLCTFEFIFIVLYIYEFKKFSQELTLYTSNCEGVDRICTQKLDQENFLEISPSLRVFIVQDFGLWVKIFGTMISPSQLLTTLLWKKWMEAYGIILAGLIITIKHDYFKIHFIHICMFIKSWHNDNMKSATIY